jgi:outer membrane protein assembly factor BamA
MKPFVSVCFIALVVSLCAFAQVTIGRVAIIDTPSISERELNQIAHEVEGKTSANNFAEGFIADQVLEAFQARGYLRATVVEPKVKASTNGRTDANVVVLPGPQYRLADLKLTGKLVFSETELAPLITAHAGTIFNIRDMHQVTTNLRQYYVAHGYPKAVVIPQSIVNDQKHQVTVVFDVQPEG